MLKWTRPTRLTRQMRAGPVAQFKAREEELP